MHAERKDSAVIISTNRKNANYVDVTQCVQSTNDRKYAHETIGITCGGGGVLRTGFFFLCY
jgi:hypothetical protein